MQRALLAILLACACGDDDGGGNGSDLPCVGDNPGVEVHITVTCTTVSPCAFQNPEVRINYPVAGLQAYPVPIASFDAQQQATARLAYPSNAGTGPATVAFFADVDATYHMHGETSFDSYPTGCVRVELAAMDVTP